MAEKWTPGPWTASEPAMGFADLRDDAGELVFALAYPSLGLGDKSRSSEECYANLSLIAAAPALYEALEDCERWLTAGESPNYHDGRRNALEAVRAALRQARGEE